MWLRDTKNHLYAKYRAECEANGRRPISKDSPVLMIPVGVAEKLHDYASNKDKAMNDFLPELKS